MPADYPFEEDSIELDVVREDAQLKMYLTAVMAEGGIIEIEKERGPTYRFRSIDNTTYERKLLTNGSTDIIDPSLLQTHFDYGDGVTRILAPDSEY